MASELPHNLDAERAIIGSIFTRPDFVAEVASDLSPDDFYHQGLATVWSVFCRMYAEEGVAKPDPVTISERSDGAIAPDMLIGFQIESATVTRQMVELVLRHSAARKMIEHNVKVNRNLMEGADPYEEAVGVESFAAQVGASSNTVEQESLTLAELMDRAESIAPNVIPGMCNQDYRTIVVAEEGAGKSLILRTIAQTVAQGLHPFCHKPIPPKRALVVDLENPAQAILDTAVKLEGTIGGYSNDYDDERFRIWRRPGGINIRRLADRAALQREIAFHRPDLVCIGPIYKMYARTGGESYEDSADDAMRVLDDLRTRYNFALFMEHHAAKGKQGEGRDLSPMGSQRWMAWPEIGISLYKDKQDPTVFDVKRFRGDRLSGVAWPDKIYRHPDFLVDGRWENGMPRW